MSRENVRDSGISSAAREEKPLKQSEPGDCSAKVWRHWRLLNVLAKARYRDVNTADEALMYVLGKLEEDNWSRVRAYREEASFRSYLCHVVYRLLTDFDRHRFGRRRIPHWVTTQGSLWEQIYKLLCLERMTANAIVETLRSAVPSGHSSEFVREAIGVIRARDRDCGASPRQQEVRLSRTMPVALPRHRRLRKSALASRRKSYTRPRSGRKF